MLFIAAAGLWAFWALDLKLSALVPNEGGLRIAQDFFSRVLSPALDYESNNTPRGAGSFLGKAATAAGQTVLFAAAAMSLALPLGLVFGFFASTAWWSGDRVPKRKFGLRMWAPALCGATRLLIVFMRSIHELLWAVLLLAALGLSHFSAVVAIAIPYAGTLAKIFSEMIDEAPRDACDALRGAGASPANVFLVGLVPRAFPNMASYSLYRFECALRSSAILGFFGFPTLGYHIASSFENLYYGEVWTYIYTLLLLVLLVDWWSGAVRRRMVR